MKEKLRPLFLCSQGCHCRQNNTQKEPRKSSPAPLCLLMTTAPMFSSVRLSYSTPWGEPYSPFKSILLPLIFTNRNAFHNTYISFSRPSQKLTDASGGLMGSMSTRDVQELGPRSQELSVKFPEHNSDLRKLQRIWQKQRDFQRSCCSVEGLREKNGWKFKQGSNCHLHSEFPV